MKRTTSLALALALPVAVLAQDGRPQPVATQIERAAPTRAEGAAAAADKGMGAVPPPDTYVIRPGDTLWDLSGRFLNNPWYWPKVWSFNPELTNPHWIEPGTVLKLYPSAEEAPARVEPLAGGAAEAAAAEEPTDVEPPRELEDFSRADMKAPPPQEQQDVVRVAGPNPIGFVQPKTYLVRHDTFVTPREVAESGKIVGAFSETMLLSTFSRAYAHFQGRAPVIPGETYLVYNTARPITQPFTGELLGYQSKIIGTARVVAVDDKAVTLVIADCYEPIERGALLGPWTERLLAPVAERRNSHDLTGHVVAASIDVLTQIGEQRVVFVDRGARDGVAVGNVFRVVRSGDPFAETIPLNGMAVPNDPALPREPIGDLLVIDVKDGVSSALVTRSVTEILIGDSVVMHAAPGAVGP